VSCTSGGACSALGTYLAKGVEQTLTAEWNGRSWSVQGGQAAGKTYPELGSVSCAAANDCEAVGAGAEGWNGTTWSAQNLPGAGLKGVSCPSTASCIGVGDATADTYDGTAWTAHDIKATPSGGSAPQLAAVSCASSAVCEAVGSYVTAGGIVVPLVLGYDGTTWSAQQTPALTTTDTTNSLAAVSCSRSGACTAVGSDAGGVFVVREGAGGWSIQSAPNPDGAIAPSITAPGLTAVSCPTANECVAVGSYTTPGGSTAAFAELWNGTSWSLQPTPKTDSDTSTSLSAITCPSPAKCVAAGTQTVGLSAPMSATTSTLTEQWTGSRWKYQSVQPLTPGDGSGAEDAVDALVGISCSSSSHCTAVGLAFEDSGCNRCGTLAERFDGHRWTLQRPSQGRQSAERVVPGSEAVCRGRRRSRPGLERTGVEAHTDPRRARRWADRGLVPHPQAVRRRRDRQARTCPGRTLERLALVDAGRSGPGGRQADRGLRRLLPVTATMRARRVLRDPGRFNGHADRALLALGRNRPGEQTRVRARLNCGPTGGRSGEDLDLRLEPRGVVERPGFDDGEVARLGNQRHDRRAASRENSCSHFLQVSSPTGENTDPFTNTGKVTIARLRRSAASCRSFTPPPESGTD
jgi:hypothetical protein